jgi:hypothetical protein
MNADIKLVFTDKANEMLFQVLQNIAKLPASDSNIPTDF